MQVEKNIGYLIQHISAVLARQSDQVLQEQLGIGFSQFKIMLMLEQSIAAQQRQIAQYLGQTEASVSRQIKLLQEQNLIQSVPNPNNRREHVTRLTPRGVKFNQKALEILNNYHEPLLAGLSARQQETLTELLGIVHASVTKDCA